MNRCEVCDRPVATDDQWRDVPEGERDDLCWGGIQCGEARVDWRARAMRADEQVTVEKRCQVNLVARLEAADRDLAAWEADARKAWSRADDEEEMRKQACRDLAAARERIGELEAQAALAENITAELDRKLVLAVDAACKKLVAERDAACRDLNQVCLAHQHERETRIAAEARAERLEALIRERQSDVMCHCDDPSGHVCWDCRARRALGET
jgi:hypothetical protein